MSVTWTTPQGDLGVYTERTVTNISLTATSPNGPITYSLIAGSLPKGLRLVGNIIKGSPVEVKKYTVNRFVIRASDGNDLEDRTFNIAVDGADVPRWITDEGYLQVGQGNAYFVLDNSYVNFQLEATDTDLTAGDKIEYYLMPMGGQLPPGLSLSTNGTISGYTDPIFAIDYNASLNGGYDTGAFDQTPIDFVEVKTNGFDDYYYDSQNYDYNEPAQTPRRLSRSYSFVVAATDGAHVISRSFKIYVVTEDFLQSDNAIVQVGTNVFTADSSADRVPLWITPSDLGRYRANNYITLFLDVYDPPSLNGAITYFLLAATESWIPSKSYSVGDLVVNNGDSWICVVAHNSLSTFDLDKSSWESYGAPPGLAIDSTTGELAGRVPYQAKVSKKFKFSVLAVNTLATVADNNYTLVGNWNSGQNYRLNDAVRYLGLIYTCKKTNVTVGTTAYNRNVLPTDSTYWQVGVSSIAKTFSVEIIGEIESVINWISDSNLGTIKPNQPSQLFVEAETKLYGNRLSYKLISGTLPYGLEFLANGKIQGKVKQFADADGPGLTRFYDLEDSVRTYNTTWDGDTTSFDKKFTIVIEANDSVEFSKLEKEFYFTVIADNDKTFANLYLKAFQSKEKRLEWSTFITDSTIFVPSEIYRYGDLNFGVQSELRLLVFAGIESTAAVKYVQAMSRNHYRKQILFGDLKMAKAKDPITQETVYEVIYVEVLDNLEKNQKSISQTVNLPDNINSKVLISYDSIKIDSDIPLASDADHQRVFPNSIGNMRKQIRGVGERDRTFLPLWMRSIQDQATYETGYVKALILCYALPGKSDEIIARIKSKTNYASRGDWLSTNTYLLNDSIKYKGNFYTCIKANTNITPDNAEYWLENFNFKDINFTADRYLIDILDGEIEDKYLAFPQRGEKLP